MPWLKYELCYADGYAEPEYMEIRSTSKEDVENAKREVLHLSDGLRTPRYEVLEALPIEVLCAKLQEAEHDYQYAVNYLRHMHKLMREHKLNNKQ